MFAGIDYSTTSPSICVKVNHCWDIHFLTDRDGLKEEFWCNPFLFFGHDVPKMKGSVHKYSYISSWALDILRNYDVEAVLIEDYAYAATGRVFNIGENTGILKYRLIKNDIKIYTVTPGEVKKFATGKGNANKELMLSNFITSTGVDVREIMNYAGENPISDIVDSYYICKYYHDGHIDLEE